MKLLSTSAKIDKSQNDDWVNVVLYLEPDADKSICLGASKGCRETCIKRTGMMAMPVQSAARLKRTEWFLSDPEAFKAQLIKELSSKLKSATKQGKRLAARLNGTSDVDWSDIYAMFPTVQFYEYTKRANLARALQVLDNVDVTMSRHERHKPERIKMLTSEGVNVAVVFDDKAPIPKEYLGVKVIDGDKHDRRFDDPKGVIVGLKLKGNNKVKELARLSGFAVNAG
jgi:hypothetical protein